MAPARDFHIAILGGGIAGLSLAIALQRHSQNVSYAIYESAPAFAEIGAGVSFGPNALRAMSLISPSVLRGFQRRCTTNQNPEKTEVWFDFQLGMDVKGEKAGREIVSVKAQRTGQTSVHRAQFLEELVALVPEGRARFGKRAIGITQLPEGRGVEIHFADGTTATASIAIGCDGIKSSIRPLVLSPLQSPSAIQAKYTFKYAYRGLIPMSKAVALLGLEKAQNAQMYLGRNGHVLTFPISHGETMNVVAFRTDPSPTGWPDGQPWVLPLPREKMQSDFAGWGKPVQDILGLMEHPDLWALFDHPPAQRYWSGRVALMGDAAHASTPHCGAGAGMALEDAYILSRLLGRVRQGRDTEIEAAFRAYDTVRRGRTQKLVEWSRETGQVYEFNGREEGDDLGKIAMELKGHFDWIWEHDLEKDLDVAVRQMEEELKSDGRGVEGEGVRSVS